MGTARTLLRWLLVPISAAFGYWFGIVLALLLYSLFDFFCPASARVSGFCYARWFHFTEEFSIYAGAAVGAALTVLLPFFAAPHHKRLVSMFAFLAGAAFALYQTIGGASSTWPYVACAIVAGLMALAWTWRAPSALKRTASLHRF